VQEEAGASAAAVSVDGENELGGGVGEEDSFVLTLCSRSESKRMTPLRALSDASMGKYTESPSVRNPRHANNSRAPGTAQIDFCSVEFVSFRRRYFGSVGC
jgi:hypothetical protein